MWSLLCGGRDLSPGLVPDAPEKPVFRPLLLVVILTASNGGESQEPNGHCNGILENSLQTGPAWEAVCVAAAPGKFAALRNSGYRSRREAIDVSLDSGAELPDMDLLHSPPTQGLAQIRGDPSKPNSLDTVSLGFLTPRRPSAVCTLQMVSLSRSCQ